MEEILTLTSICEKGILLRSSVENRTVQNWDSPSVEVLFQLLRIALGKEEPSSLPNDVNWQEVYDLSLKQGVGAIACDGMLALKECSIDEELRYKWMGQSLVIEQKYYQHKKAIAELADFYHRHNIQMMLLKGYGLSLNYPIPEHRPAGDIDIFLKWSQDVSRDDSKIEVWKYGDECVRQELGKKVDSLHEHHTVFQFQGQTVENHYDFINTKGVKSSRFIEARLKKLAMIEGKEVSVCGHDVLLPTPNLNAVFVIRHMGQHFAGASISLRHILDWATFVDRCSDESNVNWDDTISAWKEMGLLEFTRCINSICVGLLGMDKDLFHGQLSNDEELVNRVLRDVIQPEFSEEKMNGSLMAALVFKLRRFVANRWKRRMVYKEGVFEQFVLGTYAHLLRFKTIKD